MNNKTVIEVAGANSLSNEMLAHYIDTQLEAPCRIRSGYSIEGVNQNGNFILMDCSPLQRHDLFKLLETEWHIPKGRCRLALFHVDESYGVEARALRSGVCGVMHNGISLARYIRAIQAMIDGELWYPRHVLEKHFLTAHSIPKARPNIKANLLTMRECEILGLLAKGNSNAGIGRQLNISPHTVKAHAYNIYKKINVTNRRHAALWVRKNLTYSK